MIERTFIHVGGPQGSGKTTLIEAVLARSDLSILVARCLRDSRLGRARERSATRDGELRRYRAAGATRAGRFTFPKGPQSADDFFTTNLMEEFSDAVILEGEDPLGYVDLDVFVASVPRAAQRLFIRRSRDPITTARSRANEWERVLQEPDRVAQWMERVLGPAIGEHARRHPSATEELRQQLLGAIAQLREAPTSKSADHWAVAEPYRGIEHAGLVVVNIRSGRQRARAEELVAEARRLRQDPALFNDILGWRGHRTPITAIVADLTDPTDKGRRRAVARIERSMRAWSA